MYDYTKIKYLYPHEKKILFETIAEDESIHRIRNKAIFYLAEYAGLRASEIGLIKESDFVSYHKEIYCKRLKNSNNNTLRILEDDVFVSIMEHITHKKECDIDSPYLFTSQKGNPISRKTLHDIIKKYFRDAGLPLEKAHFHVLKHTRAIYLADLGLDTREIQYWLGHKSVKSTEVYFQFTSRQQEKLYQKIQFLKTEEERLNRSFMYI